MTNLDHIIKACQKGKRKAQKELYEKFSGKMYGVCLQYCKDRAEAEDCLQEGFIKVFTKIHLFRFEGSFEGWMRRIIVNTVIESFRKKQPTILVDEFPLVPCEDSEQDTMCEPLFSQSELFEMIQNLPPKYRMVFNLYALDGYTHVEIADALNISIGTSKSNLSRARQCLKKEIEARLQDKKQAVC